MEHDFLSTKGTCDKMDEINCVFFFPNVDMAIDIISKGSSWYDVRTPRMIAQQQTSEEMHDDFHEWIIISPGVNQQLQIIKNDLCLDVCGDEKLTKVIPIPAGITHRIVSLSDLQLTILSQRELMEKNAKDV